MKFAWCYNHSYIYRCVYTLYVFLYIYSSMLYILRIDNSNAVLIALKFHIFFLSQWNIDTVYQEEYFALLNATETGRRITYDPRNIATYTKPFGSYVTTAINEVCHQVLYCIITVSPCIPSQNYIHNLYNIIMSFLRYATSNWVTLKHGIRKWKRKRKMENTRISVIW